MGRHFAIAGIALAVGCTCQTPPDEDLPPSHYAGWEDLVDAAAQGDRLTAERLAFSLTEGADPESEAAGKVGAAVAFISFAEDADELAEGVAAAAAACGECHGKRVPEHLSSGPPTHAEAAQLAVSLAVWPQSTAEGPTDERLGSAWEATTREARAAQMIRACAGCHATKTPEFP